MAKSLYIHIPFCRRRCRYCNFYSTLYRHDSAARFIDACCRQVKGLEAEFETIYIGGGTPTVLPVGLLDKLLRQLARIAAGSREFSIEANPESLTGDKLKLLRRYRLNRISIGCQSFAKEKLRFLGRIHSCRRALAAVEAAKKAGFKNISIDLICGIPGESKKKWMAELSYTASLPLEHISVYMLGYEKGTELFSKVRTKEIKPLDEGKSALLYEATIDKLADYGFSQYEISNFARNNNKCIHNLLCWENEPYLGLGPAAVSFSGKKRKRNIASLARYTKAVEKGDQVWDFCEELPASMRAKETAALKIRTREGINSGWFREKTGFDLFSLERGAIGRLLAQGLIQHRGPGRQAIALSRKGLLFADTVSSAFL